MSTLTVLATNLGYISTISNAISSTYNAATAIYELTAVIIDKVEDAYNGATGSGASKKEAVMASIKTFAESIGEAWGEIKESVSEFIDKFVAAANVIDKAVEVVKGEDDGKDLIDADSVSETVSEALEAITPDTK